MKYKITFRTGSLDNAGTDAKVSIKLVGSLRSTEKLTLSAEVKSFERGSVDDFFVETDQIGRLIKIELWLDSHFWGGDWFLNDVIISSIGYKKIWYFPIQRWIKQKESFTITAVKHAMYEMEIYTGSLPGSGLKSKIEMSIIGEKTYTNFIDLSQSLDKNELKTGHKERITFIAEDVGKIKEIKLRTRGSILTSNWFLNIVQLKKTQNRNFMTFPFHRWIYSEKIYSSTNKLAEYIIKLYTGDVAYSGTDANVFMKLFGTKGSSEEIALNELIPRNAFESGNIDYIKLACNDLGNIIKVKIWHDDKWLGDGWFLNKVIIKNLKTEKEYKFPYYSWLDKSADPKSTQIELKTEIIKPRPFYAIAHMVNTPVYVEEALDYGINAIEFDITPKQNNDSFSFDVFHGFRPDFDPDKINLMERSVARTDLSNFLSSLKQLEKKHSKFTLAIYDCKLDNIKKSQLKECGKQLASLVIKEFYGSNTKDRIYTIFSVAKKRSVPFIDGIVESIPVRLNRYIGFDFSMESFPKAEKIFENRKIKNCWWGSGIASTVPKPLKHFIPQFLIAAKKRTKRGVIKKIYYWTLDDPDSMARILVTKLDGIIINDPLKLLKVLEKEEFRYTYKLANRNDKPFSVV